MKKRVLSATLAIAMLASSVGAMNVFAAEKDADAYEGKNYPAYTLDSNFSYESITLKGNPFVNAAYDEVDVFENNTIYSMDFVEAKADTNAAIEDIEDASTDEDYRAALKAFYNKDGNNTLEREKTDYSLASSTRKTVISEFLKVVDSAKGLAEDNYKDLLALYDDDEIASFKVKDLLKDIQDVVVATTATSQMAYYMSEYDRLIGTDGILTPDSTFEDKYQAKLEDVLELVEDDYSAVKWAKIEGYIATAEAYAADEKWEDALNELNNIDKVETKTPSYSDLRKALEGLFTKGEIPTISTSASVDEIPVYAGNKTCTYKKADYDDKDQWYEFAGRLQSDSDNDVTSSAKYVAGAYREALSVYTKCTKSSTRKYMPQSKVDAALENLNNAILALDPNYETPNWVIVKLEDALDKANAVVEDDYRTGSTYWKKFVEAKEDVEKLLESTNIKDKVGEDYYDALIDAMDDLSKCQKTVPADTKNDLNVAIKEAKSLLKDKDGKTASQITNLEAALKDAEAVYNKSGKTISAYENATAALNDAMTAFNQIQGWYQENGTWYYGKEDTVAKGWLNVNGVWYLLDDTTGAMKTGWQQVNGTWYYLNASGAMQTGWLNLNGTYYYLESWGGMATGWKSVNGSWYYLQSSGAMVANGWYWINGKCYYFYNWGGMAANTTIDGYTVDASGAWVR